VGGLTADDILRQSLHKLKMEVMFEGRHSGISWYDWHYQFKLKMMLTHLWPFYKGESRLLRIPDRDAHKRVAQLSLLAFAVLNVSVSDQIQQAIRTYSDQSEPARKARSHMMDTFHAKDGTNLILSRMFLDVLGSVPCAPQNPKPH